MRGFSFDRGEMSLLRNLFGRKVTPAPRAAATAVGAVPAADGTIVGPESGKIADEAARLDDVGRHTESLALVSRALQTAPADAELLFAKGRALLAAGRSREALAAYLVARDNGLSTPSFLLHLGWAYLGAGAANEAEGLMRKVVVDDPENWKARFGLAKALQARGRIAEAMDNYEGVLARNPDEIESMLNLGVCRIAVGDAAAAEAQFRRALALAPAHASAWNSLGVALEHQRRHSEAREAYERATQIESKGNAVGGSYVNLALSLQGEGRTAEALEVLERNLARHGGADAHGNYAQALRLAGRLAEGWTHFEFRWLREPLLSSRPSLAKPVWRGQNLRGKTILLRAEQGLGDTLQFIRYAPHVKAQGATVLLSAQSALRDLLRDFPGVDRMLGPDDSLPHIDYYVHLLSLPGVFATALDSIPADVPYLRADPARVERWSKRLDNSKAFNVGIVWAGRLDHVKDRDRSLSLRALGSLGGIDGVRFHSLQKGPPADEAKAPPPGLALVDLSAEINDFADTAAVIDRMDLVISVDTAVAHLAGAMGKPVWLMLPAPAEWRWMEDREDSPWYPTMRLFRQRHRGDWTDVVERMKAALQVRARDAGTMASSTRVSAEAKREFLRPVAVLPRDAPGHRPGFSAVAETRYGILQYLPDEPRVGDSLGWYGEYLQAQLDVLIPMLHSGAAVLEAGASVGQHALPLSAAIGPSGHLIVDEPRRMQQQMLRRNLNANGAANVTLLQDALGTTNAASEMQTVDGLQLAQLDCLMLDDDRALAILEGASETLWRLRPMLVAAVPDAQAQVALADSARRFGYRVFRLSTPLFNPCNFNGRTDDVFAGEAAVGLFGIPEEVQAPALAGGIVELD